jgi:hypothetical protein
MALLRGDVNYLGREEPARAYPVPKYLTKRRPASAGGAVHTATTSRVSFQPRGQDAMVEQARQAKVGGDEHARSATGGARHLSLRRRLPVILCCLVLDVFCLSISSLSLSVSQSCLGACPQRLPPSSGADTYELLEPE